MICGFFTQGCVEYNRIPTVSEENSLSGIVQLTDGFDRAGEAFVSSDSRWIVFRAVPAAGQPPRLYLAKLISGESGPIGIEKPICITRAGTRSAHGAFSPDDLSLVFASSATATGQMNLFRVDGWEGAIAMTDRSTGIDLARNVLATGVGDSQGCSFSPDGKWICFSLGPKGGSRICVMHADGSHIVQLTDPKDNAAQPSFSPDAKRLVYVKIGEKSSQIVLAKLVLDHDGEITSVKDEQPLTHDDRMNINPAWHPDSRHIIYATSRHARDNYELYLMDLSGRRKTRITFFDGADLLPVFSSDGKYLMWTSKRSKDATDEVFVAKFQFPRGS